MGAAPDKVVLVTRKTRLEELVARFNSQGQARFYIEHAGGDFAEYVREDDAYRRSLEVVVRGLEPLAKVQPVERRYVPTFLFSSRDVLVTAGQDGLVANVAKYAGGQPIVAVNPDPARFDGVLLPFAPKAAPRAVRAVLEGEARVREVTLAEVALNDGQRLRAFNDLFAGAQSHVSARYKISVGGASEVQSSSGVLISTGAGSTGWLSSVFNMVAGVRRFLGEAGAGGASAGKGTLGAKIMAKARGGDAVRMGWEDPRLLYVVREPFASRHSSAELVAGMLAAGEELVLESLMPSGGVLFSDGVEADYLAFNAGAIARVRAAEQKARLVVGEG